MITNSNQVYFAKVLGREVQEEVLNLSENFHTEAILTLSPASLHS